MTDPVPDDALAPRLPLPLARLYRRAHNAKTPLERHLTAFYLWEASLKLLAAAAVAEYARLGEVSADDLAGRLRNLARPALGHWWEFARVLVPLLADRGSEAFGRSRDLLLGRARADLPRAAGLDAALREALDGNAGSRSTVSLAELFDRLVRYRNREVGHGAVGRRPAAFYDRMGAAFLAAGAEVLARLDVLAGRQLLYVGEVRQVGGVWLAQRYQLEGESPRRLPALELPRSESARLPDGDRVYLGGPAAAGADGLVPLHPLLVYDAEAEEALFLSARRGRQRTEYLCYTTGATADRTDLDGDQIGLLARLLGAEVSPDDAAAWAARSRAEEPPVEPPADARRSLGEFELLGELGRGGMGVVYRAWQPSLGREVALKKLLQAGDDRAEARFRREVRALGRVEHPNLVKVFTSGSDGDQWFYAMELVEGVPLSVVCERLAGRPGAASTVDLRAWQEAVSTAWAESRRAEKLLGDTPPAPEPPTPLPAALTGGSYARHAVELVRQAALAAHALHEAGVIHRDIKPGNLMVTADGSQAVLMDLGLAQLADEEEGRVTRTRQFVGTLRYASPQQVLAADRLDRRTDVYSLGATLWELLALRPMFGATDQTPSPVLMERIQRDEPERLRRANPAVGRDLEAVTHKCLEKSADRRYATAKELADDLGRYLAGEPVTARPVRGLERAAKWARRRPAAAALVGVSGLAALALLAGGGWFTWKLDRAATAENERANEAQASKERAETALGRVQETLAEGLLRPLGHREDNWSINQAELEALWDLATLPKENDPARLLFLEKALARPETAEHLANRRHYAVHAAVGLSNARRRQVEEMLLRRLQTAGAEWAVRRECALMAVELGPADARLAEESALALVEDVSRSEASHDSSGGLAVLAPRLSPEAARRAAGRALDALADLADQKGLARAGFEVAGLARPGVESHARGHNQLARLGFAVAELAPRFSDPDAREVCAAAVDRLLKAYGPAEAVRPLARWLRPEDAGRAARRVGEALATAPVRAALGDRCQVLAALAPRLPPGEARAVCTDAARRLRSAVAETGPDESSQPLLDGLAALAPWLEPGEAADIARRALEALTRAKPGEEASKPDPSDLAILAPLLSPKDTEAAAGPVLRALVEAENGPVRNIALESFRTVAGRLGPAEAAAVARRALESMAKSKEPAEAAAFGQAVAALANRLDARDAETTRAAAVRRLLATFAEPRDDPFPSGLARALEDLAPWLSPDEARAVARLALTAQVSEDDPLSPPRDDLAEVLAVTPRLAPDDARATARWARAEIEAGTPVERMAYLGRVAAAVSPRLDPGEARDACVAACRRLIARIDARGGSPLAEQARALAALAPRVGPDEARAVSRITLGSLATVREGYPFSQLARALAAVAGRMGPGEAPLAANRFLDTFHWSTGLQEQDPPDAVQIRRTLTALTEQLDRDQLLDLLKHPICVGDARKIVLRRLEVVMNHPFATVWDLVDYLEQTEPGLDLSTPPTRPSR